MRIQSRILLFFGVIATIIFLSSQFQTGAVEGTLDSRSKTIMNEKPEGYAVATLAGGCFWCLESELRRLDGVLFTRVGYSGGNTNSPLYEQVSTGNTGHAEAVEVTYNPDKLSYEDIVRFFLTKAHDPTQLNRQGVDIGTQYRSAIYYHDDNQKKVAADLIAEVQPSYKQRIVTELAPAQKFWEAEGYHQQYYEKYEEQNGQIHPRVYFKQQTKMMGGK